MDRIQLKMYTQEITAQVKNHFDKKFSKKVSNMIGYNLGYIIIRIREFPIISNSGSHEEFLTNAKYLLEIIKFYSKDKLIEVRFIYKDRSSNEDYKPDLVLYTQDFKKGDRIINIETKKLFEINIPEFYNEFTRGKYLNLEWYNVYKEFMTNDFLK